VATSPQRADSNSNRRRRTCRCDDGGDPQPALSFQRTRKENARVIAWRPADRSVQWRRWASLSVLSVAGAPPSLYLNARGAPKNIFILRNSLQKAFILPEPTSME